MVRVLCIRVLGLVRSARLRYGLAMGIGSLARYRRYILLLGGLLFFGGAIMRWHGKRHVESLEQPGTPVARTEASWAEDCKSYACRVTQVSGAECNAMCQEASASGVPKVSAERIAFACKKYCPAEEPENASCHQQCLIREARRSATLE